MPDIRTAVLCTCLCVLATAAAAKDKRPAGKAHPSPPAEKSAEGSRLALMSRSDPKGFTIQVPATAEETREEWSTTYKAVLAPDAARISAIVTVEALDELTPVTNLEKAVEAAIARRPRGVRPAIAEQRDLPDGYLVVIGPDYGTYAVTVIRNGKEVQVKAHCSGPDSRLEDLKRVCLSVKPTK